MARLIGASEANGSLEFLLRRKEAKGPASCDEKTVTSPSESHEIEARAAEPLTRSSKRIMIE
jgi:hypothetical protein